MTYLAIINYDELLKKIKPSDEENLKVKKLADRLINILNNTANTLNIEADAVLVGSVAKGTWLSGNADIDILIKFPLDVDESVLKAKGLVIGHECILKMNGTSEERYASHPYVTGYIDGYYVDFVPCYDISNSEQLKSAVDRTLLHTKYITANLTKKQADEVILLKKFMKSVGTYGSEFKVGGFAGYLCEILILRYGTFEETLRNAATLWNNGYVVDLENHDTAKLFKDPLIAIDPVDKNRNVAASLTLQKMSEFVVASGNFIDNPSEKYFSKKVIDIKQENLKNQFIKRETKTIILSFKPPKIPADAVYPQIKKTENSILKVLKSEGFEVFGSSSWTDENKTVIILLEFETWKLPRIKKHLGPYIWTRNI